MTPIPGQDGGQRAWFCVRSQPKHEHIAAAHLAKDLQVEVFLPRIRFRQLVGRGSRMVTEPLFPGYLFARFEWRGQLRAVRHGRGVASVVHFGHRWPTVPDEVIDSLRRELGPEEMHNVTGNFQPGEEVQIAGGSFHGLLAIVHESTPARQRVAVLMDFLGRQVSIEVAAEHLVRPGGSHQRRPA